MYFYLAPVGTRCITTTSLHFTTLQLQNDFKIAFNVFIFVKEAQIVFGIKIRMAQCHSPNASEFVNHQRN